MNITTLTRSLSILALVPAALSAATFDFKDPKGVNNVAFSMDAPLEYITGTGTGISGTVDFDIDHPEHTKGKIILDTASLMVGNSTMRDHMLGKNWMDVAQYPQIVFSADKLTDISVADSVVRGTIHGSITIKGVTEELAVPVSLTYLPGKLGARTNGAAEGDLLVIRAEFTVLRSVFGINAGNATDKVADEIELKLSIAGASAK
jgi:polyisoprenoid-binding protein YceI